MKELTVTELFDLDETIAGAIFEGITYPWEVLPKIGEFIVNLGNTLPEDEYEKAGENIWIARSAKVASTACINGPTIIGKDAEIRHCAGYKSHMGAGSITSNVKSDKTLATVNTPEGKMETGLKKFGAMLGDYVEVGCGSVLNPGTVVGRNTNIYPLSMVRGYVGAGSIYKKQGEVVEKQ